jgi:hypothetical protein
LPFPFWVFVYLSSSTYLDRFVGWATRTCWSHWHGQWSVFPLFYILSDFSDDRIPLSLFFLFAMPYNSKYWVPCSLFK